jgi:hypothetical protein
MLTGTESMRLTPGITAMNSLDLFNMPFTHGLAGVAIQSVAFGLLVAALIGDGRRLGGGLIAGMAVFSHWVLDVITHRPDMMLFHPEHKIGAALWDHPDAAMFVETAVIVAAFALFWALTKPRGGSARIALIVMAAAMVALQCVNWFVPQPDPVTTSLQFVAIQGLVAYAIFMVLAWWLESTREVA